MSHGSQWWLHCGAIIMVTCVVFWYSLNSVSSLKMIPCCLAVHDPREMRSQMEARMKMWKTGWQPKELLLVMGWSECLWIWKHWWCNCLTIVSWGWKMLVGLVRFSKRRSILRETWWTLLWQDSEEIKVGNLGGMMEAIVGCIMIM